MAAQLCWNVDVDDWAISNWAPSRASRLLMSGNADSKQISGPMRSLSAPAREECTGDGGSGTDITTCRFPRSRSSPAALPTDVTQPSTERAGMYSPNGTRRILS